MAKYKPFDGEGKKKLIIGSGVLFDKVGEEYFMLTAAHNFQVYGDVAAGENEPLELLDAKFLL